MFSTKAFSVISAIVVAASTANATGDFGASLPSACESVNVLNTSNGVAFVIFSNASGPTAAIPSTAGAAGAKCFAIGPGASRRVNSGGNRYVGVILNTGATAGNVFLEAGMDG